MKPRRADFIVVAISTCGMLLTYVMLFHRPTHLIDEAPLTPRELAILAPKTMRAAQAHARESDEPVLSAIPTGKQRFIHFGKLEGRSAAKARLAIAGAGFFGVSLAHQPTTARSLDGTVAGTLASIGDFRGARNELRRAVRTAADAQTLDYLCGELAWLEDDLGNATMLLQTSLANGPGDAGDEYSPLSNALNLALSTESFDLAKDFWQEHGHDLAFCLNMPNQLSRDTKSWIRDHRLESLRACRSAPGNKFVTLLEH